MPSATSSNVLRRNTDRRMIAGVCAGIADRFDLDPLLVRLATVILVVGTGGVAALGYLIMWAAIPAVDVSGVATAPATHRARHRTGSVRIAIGTGLIVLAVLLVFRQLGIWWSDALVWPLVLAAAGATLLWRQSGEREPESEIAGRAEARADGSAARPARAAAPAETDGRPGRWTQARRLYRGGFGVALVLGAGVLFLYANGVLNAAGDAALAALVALVALTLILAPFWWRLGRNLADERAERIRSQERAELAAHLHDSVLQTLALMQKRADDPQVVATLARRQERELRAWLQGGAKPRPDQNMADALRAAAAEVEEEHGVVVDVVVVGDCPLDEHVAALVAAAREAMVNAAKFAASAGPVQVYAEAGPEHVQVFVRDRGPGFDPDAVPSDRHGIRESIIGRIHRHGGRAEVRAEAGLGTEVELEVKRASTSNGGEQP